MSVQQLMGSFNAKLPEMDTPLSGKEWPNSSNLIAAAYCHKHRVLFAQFKKPAAGTTGMYRYENVPAQLAEDLMIAESSGSFFFKHFRKDYKGIPVMEKVEL